MIRSLLPSYYMVCLLPSSNQDVFIELTRFLVIHNSDYVMFSIHKIRSVVFLVVILAIFPATQACSDNAYIHQGRCCRKCSRGFFVKEHCSANRSLTVCQPCSNGTTFAKDANNNTSCELCYTCQPARMVKKLCTTTTNTECKCPAQNQYYAAGTANGCVLCQTCPAGQFPENPCGGYTICSMCSEGYYSNRTKNYHFSCSECTKCKKYKRICNTTHDAICGDVPREIIAIILTTAGSISEGITTTKKDHNVRRYSFHDFRALIIIAGIVCGLFMVLLLVLIVKRRKIPCIKPHTGCRSNESYEALNTGYLLRDQPVTLILKLHDCLNPDIKPNWRTLGGKLGFTHVDILNFEVDRQRSAENMLATWQTKAGATVDVLHQSLVEIGRTDAAQIVCDNVKYQTESFV